MERYNAFWRRLAAGLFDGLVLIIISLLGIKFFLSGNQYSSYGLTFSLALLPILYSVLLTGLVGQTIGKIVMGIKVLDISEKEVIGIKRAIFRDSVLIIFQMLSLFIITIKNFEILHISDQVSSFFESMISRSSFCWFVLELITMFINEKRRAIHDFLASSVVISLKGLRFDKIDEEIAVKKATAVV